MEALGINDSGIIADVDSKKPRKNSPIVVRSLENSQTDFVIDMTTFGSDCASSADSGVEKSPSASDETSLSERGSAKSNGGATTSNDSLYDIPPPVYQGIIHSRQDSSLETSRIKEQSSHTAGQRPESSMVTDEVSESKNSFDDTTSSTEDLPLNETREPLLDSAVKNIDLKAKSNCCIHCYSKVIKGMGKFYVRHEKEIILTMKIFFIFFNLVWLAVGMSLNYKRCMPFLVIICLVAFFSGYSVLKRRFGRSFQRIRRICPTLSQRRVKWVASVCVVCALGLWIAFDTSKRPHQLLSLVGYVVFLVFLLMISIAPEDVKWRPVLWGCGIQVILGLFILRVPAGFVIFNYLGDLVKVFLEFAGAGSQFVFGSNYKEHLFAFAVLPIIIFFSAFISILYHFGAMQWAIAKIAWLMQISLGTSATESMVAAGNIFVGQTESPLLIRPYIKDLTTSELHAVMTAGFGTIAGSVLGAYMEFGVKPVYVVTACVMAAPCALAVSKLLYPEKEESKFLDTASLKIESSGHRNVIEAAFVGASQAIPLVLNIGANLIAFIALLTAINAFLNWYGSLVGIENLSFELLCSYIFLPFSYLMGIEWQDCYKCAELIGTKIFLNEFIAYEKLASLIDNREGNALPKFNESTGELHWISERSEAIITYALCGFANVGSLGIMLGGLGGMCPERQSEMAKIVLRALTGGIFVSLLNACVAGFFYEPLDLDCQKLLNIMWEFSEVGNVYQCCSSLDLTNSTVLSMQCCNYTWPSSFSALEGC